MSSATAARARLSLGGLRDLPASAQPPIDPRELSVGIVHLGIGAFHRAHQAVFTQDAIAAAGGEWGICGVTQRSPAVRDALAPQDGLFALSVRGAGLDTVGVVASVREVLWARASPDAVRERIAAPATAVVTLTVTEKAYHRDAATGGLALGDPDLAADLAQAGERTVLGQLVGGLDARRRSGGPPLAVVCCDNLSGNGAVLARLVAEFAQRRAGSDGLADWIAQHVRFPATMVDRIVPASTDADRARVAAALGMRDEGLVVAEPFSQWVIEDDFPGPRPAWERAGATVTGEVAPYEAIKLRMLNGSHSTLAYLGALAGYELIAQAAASDALRGVVAGLMADEVAATVAVPDGFDLPAYEREVLTRFANPALPHRTQQVAMDGSQKLPERLLGTVRDRRAAGAMPTHALLGVAAWMRFVSARRSDTGRPLTVDDPLAPEIARRTSGASSASAVVDALLGLREVFGEDLPEDAELRDTLVGLLQALARGGAERAAADLLDG